jgi:hypothetical protein
MSFPSSGLTVGKDCASLGKETKMAALATKEKALGGNVKEIKKEIRGYLSLNLPTFFSQKRIAHKVKSYIFNEIITIQTKD